MEVHGKNLCNERKAEKIEGKNEIMEFRYLRVGKSKSRGGREGIE